MNHMIAIFTLAVAVFSLVSSGDARSMLLIGFPQEAPEAVQGELYPGLLVSGGDGRLTANIQDTNQRSRDPGGSDSAANPSLGFHISGGLNATVGVDTGKITDVIESGAKVLMELGSLFIAAIAGKR